MPMRDIQEALECGGGGGGGRGDKSHVLLEVRAWSSACMA